MAARHEHGEAFIWIESTDCHTLMAAGDADEGPELAKGTGSGISGPGSGSHPDSDGRSGSDELYRSCRGLGSRAVGMSLGRW